MLEIILGWMNSLSGAEIVFLIYFGLLFITWLYKCRGIEQVRKRAFPNYPQLEYGLAVNKKAFIKEVIRWGINNLSNHNSSCNAISVNFEVSYYKHKKHKGVFFSNQNKIRVYINNHSSIDDIIDTSLHEVVHLLQYNLDKKNFQKNYTKLLEEKTYSKHPMEIEARKLAAAHTRACKEFMITQGKIVPQLN